MGREVGDAPHGFCPRGRRRGLQKRHDRNGLQEGVGARMPSREGIVGHGGNAWHGGDARLSPGPGPGRAAMVLMTGMPSMAGMLAIGARGRARRAIPQWKPLSGRFEASWAMSHAGSCPATEAAGPRSRKREARGAAAKKKWSGPFVQLEKITLRAKSRKMHPPYAARASSE